MHGPVLGPLHTRCCCLAWGSCGTPSCWSGGFSVTLALLSRLFFYLSGLPHSALIWWIVSSANTSCSVWYPWKDCSFLRGNGGAMDVGKQRSVGVEEGRENCRERKLHLGCIVWKRILKRMEAWWMTIKHENNKKLRYKLIELTCVESDLKKKETKQKDLKTTPPF